MLGGDDRLDDVGNVVYIWEGFYAKENIIKGLLGRMSGILGCSHDCRRRSVISRLLWCKTVRTSVGLKSLVAVEFGSRHLSAIA